MRAEPTTDIESRLIAVRVNEAEVSALVELMKHELKSVKDAANETMPATRAIVKVLTAYIAPVGQCMICGRKADNPGDVWWQVAICLCDGCATEG